MIVLLLAAILFETSQSGVDFKVESETQAVDPAKRPPLVGFQDCTNVVVDTIALHNTPSVVLAAERTRRLAVSGVEFIAPVEPDGFIVLRDSEDAHVRGNSYRIGDGRIPPEGADNICVYYSTGGGTVGNLPVGSVTDLIDAIPMVDNVTNVTDTCGGTDGGDRAWLEEVGTLRLRHRDRAMGADDYEDMVRQNFPRVRRVKCFAGFDERGRRAPGHVTVVFLCSEATNLADTNVISKQIFRYLSEHCDCLVIHAHRLHVLPAAEMRICVEAQLELQNPDRAADTQQQITAEVTNLIDGVWRQRGIGQALRTEELYELFGQASNVAQVRQVLIRGVYIEDGVERACNLEEEQDFPYSAVRSGNHTIRVV